MCSGGGGGGGVKPPPPQKQTNTPPPKTTPPKPPRSPDGDECIISERLTHAWRARKLQNLLIGFLSPQIDPGFDPDGPTLPTANTAGGDAEEHKPFTRKLAEFQFWSVCQGV